MNELEDRFLDTMLEEALGRAVRPDLTIRPAPPRTAVWGGWTMSAAAVLVVSVVASLIVTLDKPPAQHQEVPAQDEKLMDERLIMKLPGDRFIDYVDVSPTGKMIAYIAAADDGDGWVVVVNHRPSGPYQDIPRYLVFSPTESAVAFIGKSGQESRVVVMTDNGTAKPEPVHRVNEGSIVFSPKGDSLAYSCERYVVVDGQKGPTFDTAGIPRFSSNDSRVAYAAAFRGEQFAVIDNQRHPLDEPCFDGVLPCEGYDLGCSVWRSPSGSTEFDIVVRPLFFRESWHAAKTLNMGQWGDRLKLIDSKVDDILRLVPEGPVRIDLQNGEAAHVDRASKRVLRQILKTTAETRQWGMTFGDEPEIWCDGDPSVPVFSPDGTRAAYPALKGKRWTIVSGRKQSESYDQVWPPVFSRDGKKVAFACRKGAEVWWKTMALGE